MQVRLITNFIASLYIIALNTLIGTPPSGVCLVLRGVGFRRTSNYLKNEPCPTSFYKLTSIYKCMISDTHTLPASVLPRTMPPTCTGTRSPLT